MFILCWCLYISQDVVAVSWTSVYILFDSYARVSNASESTDVIELAPFVLLVFFPIRVVDRCRMKKCYSCVSLLVIKSRGTLTALYLYISAAASRYVYTYICIYICIQLIRAGSRVYFSIFQYTITLINTDDASCAEEVGPSFTLILMLTILVRGHIHFTFS